MNQFQVRTRARTRLRMVTLLLIAGVCVGLFELYRLLVPFDNLNPLWSEATIGQTVLDNWRYGGQDAEGYLKFYNDSETALLPPNAHLFDANGRFIVLEQHTPSSITYALPRNALPMSWVLGGAALVALPIGLIVLRLRNRTGWQSARRPQTITSSSKMQRFKGASGRFKGTPSSGTKGPSIRFKSSAGPSSGRFKSSSSPGGFSVTSGRFRGKTRSASSRNKPGPPTHQPFRIRKPARFRAKKR